jgi:citrate synthase
MMAACAERSFSEAASTWYDLLMGKMNKDDGKQQYSEQETARRRDEAVRRALHTPPRPYKDSKVGAAKSKSSSSASSKKR